MIRVASTLSALLLAHGIALGQSFQTALPLDPSERRAMEAQLSTILDFAAPGEVRRFSLPSGRIVTVRPYRAVRRPGDAPCRGYRIDLLGNGEAVAVDGFRCRRSDGNAWLITEPEIVLAQNGAPLDLRGTVSPDEESADRTDPSDLRTRVQEALGSDSAFFSPGEVPPVPRRAPREDIAASAEESEPENDEAVAVGPETLEAPEDDALVAEVAEGIAAGPLPSATAPPVPEGTALPLPQEDADDRPQPEERTTASLRDVTPPGATGTGGSAGLGVVRIPAPETPDARSLTATPGADAGDSARQPRVVNGLDQDDERIFSGDPRILDALRDLAYLQAEGAAPPAAAVRSAIDAFARDERFALPVSSAALLTRLDNAIARRETLVPCTSAPPDVPCIVGE